MGDRTWLNLKCRKIDLARVTEIIDGPSREMIDGEYTDPFNEIMEEDGVAIEGQIYEVNYGGMDHLEEIAEAKIPFAASHGVGGDYGPAVIACDGERLYQVPASYNGYPYVEIGKDGEFIPGRAMQNIREYYLILEKAEKLIEKGV
jgi:hypothetical protein